MPSSRAKPKPERKLREHRCPFCGFAYMVHLRPSSRSGYHTAICSGCGDVMAEWHGRGRYYRRIKKRPDPNRFAAAIVAIAADAAKKIKRGKIDTSVQD